jgi:SAM-dependent methyltransferase
VADAIDPVAAAGFGAEAAAYERSRPSYPEAAVGVLVDQLELGAGVRVLDLAAGTGKMTRLLLATGADVVAVEPVAAMREQLRRGLGVEALEGAAEAIPLPDRSVDAVVVAQAFHWFDAPRALAEIARVLQPGGALALVWNERDETVPWVAELSRIMHWDTRQPYRVGTDWRTVVDPVGLFTPLQHRRFPHAHEIDVDLLLGRVVSTSYIAAMGPAERAPMLERVRALVAGFPPTFPLPYDTDVWWCRART